MRGGISSNLGREMLPIAGAEEVDCRRDLTESDTGCYLAGDIRANEQVIIILMWYNILTRQKNEVKQKNGFLGWFVGHAYGLDQRA